MEWISVASRIEWIAACVGNVGVQTSGAILAERHRVARVDVLSTRYCAAGVARVSGQLKQGLDIGETLHQRQWILGAQVDALVVTVVDRDDRDAGGTRRVDIMC